MRSTRKPARSWPSGAAENLVKKIEGSNVMTHAIRFHKPGGPEVLVWEEVSLGKPGPGEARIRHTAVGLNFVDIYNRSGLYPVQLPSGLGGEATGVVEEVGPA
jgi:NADPH:quinone reductase